MRNFIQQIFFIQELDPFGPIGFVSEDKAGVNDSFFNSKMKNNDRQYMEQNNYRKESQQTIAIRSQILEQDEKPHTLNNRLLELNFTNRQYLREEANGIGQMQNQKNGLFSDRINQNQLNNITMINSQSPSSQNPKTFVFQNQNTCQSSIAYYAINSHAKHTDLRPIFQKHCPIQSHHIEMFNTLLSKFVNIDKFNETQKGLIPNEYLQYGFIMIRFKALKNLEEQQGSDDSRCQSSEQSINRKDRSKERTIGQVIELVKQWRKLHEGVDGKKLNLQEAAKMVGISKKSLDDYYYQLRLGQQNDFEFNQNLNQKIGVLRTFVKSKKPQKSVKHRNSKHPKKLKIIQEFQEKDREPDNQNDNQVRSKQQPFMLNSPAIKNLQSQSDQHFFQDSASMAADRDFADIENNYYQNFGGNYLDQDEDPFFYTGNFKKKQSWSVDQDSDILF